MRPATRIAKPAAEKVPGLGSGWGEHDQHDAEEEQQRQDQDRLAAPDLVRDDPAEQGTDRGGEQQGADDHAQLEQGEPEFFGHRTLGAVGHAGVVAEQQAAQAGDDRDQADPLSMGTACQGW